MQWLPREEVNVMQQRPTSVRAHSMESCGSAPGNTARLTESPQSHYERAAPACVWPIRSFEQCALRAGAVTMETAADVASSSSLSSSSGHCAGGELTFVLTLDPSADEQHALGEDAHGQSPLPSYAISARRQWRLLSHLFAHAVSPSASRGRLPTVLLSSALPHSIRSFTFGMPITWSTAPPHSLACRQEQMRARLAELLRWLPPLRRHVEERCEQHFERRKRQRKRPQPQHKQRTSVDEGQSDAAWVQSKVVTALSHVLTGLVALLEPLSVSASSPLSLAVTAATVVPVDAALSASASPSSSPSPAVVSNTQDASYLHVRCTLLENTDVAGTCDPRDRECEGASEVVLAETWAADVKTWASRLPPSSDINASYRAAAAAAEENGEVFPETVLGARLRTHVAAVHAHLPLFTSKNIKVRTPLDDAVSAYSAAPTSVSSPPPPPTRAGRSLRLHTLNAAMRQEVPGLSALQTYIAICLALITELTDFDAHSSPSPSERTAARTTTLYRDSELTYLTELLCFYAMAVSTHTTPEGEGGAPVRDRAATRAHVALWVRTHLVASSDTAPRAQMFAALPSLTPLYASLFGEDGPLSLHALLMRWRHWLVLRVVRAAVDWTSLWMSACVRVLVPRCHTPHASTLASSSVMTVYRLTDVCHEQFRFWASKTPSQKHAGRDDKSDARVGLMALTACRWSRRTDTSANGHSACLPSSASVSEADVSGSDGSACGVGGVELGQRLWDDIVARFPDTPRPLRVLLHFFELFHARFATSHPAPTCGVCLEEGPAWYVAMRDVVATPDETGFFQRAPRTCTVTFQEPCNPPPERNTDDSVVPVGAPHTPRTPPLSVTLDTALAISHRHASWSASEGSFEELSCSTSPYSSSGNVSPTHPHRRAQEGYASQGEADGGAQCGPALPVLCRWSYREFLKVFGRILLYHVHYGAAPPHHSLVDNKAMMASQSEAHARLVKSALAPADRLRLPLMRCLSLCQAAHIPMLVCPHPITPTFVAETQQQVSSVLFSIARGEVLVQHVCVLEALLAATAEATARLQQRVVVALQSFLRCRSAERWHVRPQRQTQGLVRLTTIQAYLRARLSMQRMAARRDQLEAASKVDTRAEPVHTPAAVSPKQDSSRVRHGDGRRHPDEVCPHHAASPVGMPLFAWSACSPALASRHTVTPLSSSSSPLPSPPKSRLAPILSTLEQLEAEGRYWIYQEVQLVWQEFVIDWERLQRVSLYHEETSEAELFDRMLCACWETVPPREVAHSGVRRAADTDADETEQWPHIDDADAERLLSTPDLVRNALHVARFGTPRVAEHRVKKDAAVPPAGCAATEARTTRDDFWTSPWQSLTPTSDVEDVDSDSSAKAIAALVSRESMGRADLQRRYVELMHLLEHHYAPLFRQRAVLSTEALVRAQLCSTEALVREEMQRRWCVLVLPYMTASELCRERCLADRRVAAARSLRLETAGNVDDATTASPPSSVPANPRRPRQRQRGVTLFARPSDLPPPVRASATTDGSAAPATWAGAALRATDFELSTPGPSIMTVSSASAPPPHVVRRRNAPVATSVVRPVGAGSVPLDHDAYQEGTSKKQTYAASPSPSRAVPVVAVSLRDGTSTSTRASSTVSVASTRAPQANSFTTVDGSQPIVHRFMPRHARSSTPTDDAAHTMSTSPDAAAPLSGTFPENVGSDEYQRLKKAVEGSPDGPRTSYRSARTTAELARAERSPRAPEHRADFTTLSHRVTTVPRLSVPLLDQEVNQMVQFINGDDVKTRRPLLWKAAITSPTDAKCTRVVSAPTDADEGPLGTLSSSTASLPRTREAERTRVKRDDRARRPSLHDWSLIPRRRKGRVSVVTWAEAVIDTS